MCYFEIQICRHQLNITTKTLLRRRTELLLVLNYYGTDILFSSCTCICGAIAAARKGSHCHLVDQVCRYMQHKAQTQSYSRTVITAGGAEVPETINLKTHEGKRSLSKDYLHLRVGGGSPHFLMTPLIYCRSEVTTMESATFGTG